jgi:glycosyltransferase involved in cell wall biosynthesis
VRIAIVPTPDLACETGSTTYCVALVEALGERGHDVVVLCRTKPPDSEAACYLEVDVPLEHPVFVDRPVSDAELWQSLQALARSLIELGNARRVDVVHAFYASFTGAAAATAGWLTGTPYVVSAFGRDLTLAVGVDRRYRALANAAVSNAASVLVTTDALRERAESLDVDADRVAVLPMGIDERRFGEIRGGRWSEDRPRLLVVGSSFTPEKGIDLVLQALPEVLRVQPNAKLLVAGDDDHPSRANEARLRESARMLRVDHAVTFLGRVRHRDVPRLLADATVFVDARTAGNFSSSLLEAAVSGVPTVCTDVANSPGFVFDQVSGHVVGSGDVPALSRALTATLSDHERWRSLRAGAAARRGELLDRFGLRKRIGDHESVYAAAVNSGGRALEP